MSTTPITITTKPRTFARRGELCSFCRRTWRTGCQHTHGVRRSRLREMTRRY